VLPSTMIRRKMSLYLPERTSWGCGERIRLTIEFPDSAYVVVMVFVLLPDVGFLSAFLLLVTVCFDVIQYSELCPASRMLIRESKVFSW
jgi:hypothetical protein